MTDNNISVMFDILQSSYPNAVCELEYKTPYQLLVAVILSAQCTDKRVNMVTPRLFERCMTPHDMANIPLDELSEYIRPCGFFNTKARALIDCAVSLCQNFGGEVPDSMEDLLTIRGVGRKTANVMLSVAFGQPAIAVDTHVKRLANRLGIADSDDVNVIEQQLMKALPKEQWSQFHHLLIHHGRYTCKAINPQCDKCTVQQFCKKFFGDRPTEML